MSYAELQVTTNFSFLRGASHPDEFFAEAAALGHTALAVTDRNSLAGIVRAHVAAKEWGVRLIVGCRLDLKDGSSLLVYPTDKKSYSRLCRLLSIGKGRAGKGACDLSWDDLLSYHEGLIAILVPDAPDQTLKTSLEKLRSAFGRKGYLALTLRRRPNDAFRIAELNRMAQEMGVLTVVTNDALFHSPSRRILQDVVSCIREKRTIDNLGFRRERFADRHLKAPEEMQRLFKSYPEAYARAANIARECRFTLDELQYQYPAEVSMPGFTPQETLSKLTWEGMKWRYPEGAPQKVIDQIHHELTLIEKLNYAPYFLTVHSIVRFARSKGILCQGRGSAANSAICFVLAITSIDPAHNNLLFERFISQERHEPPDIDVDFEHERREEVIQWVYETYGRTRAALTATVITYRMKGAIRDVGKALGLSEDILSVISGQIWAFGREAVGEKHLAGLSLNREDRRLQMTLDLAHQLAGFPRHLSQHPGGFVLSHERLDDLVPIEPASMENRQVIEWDKDDIDVLKFMKVDVLGLGMLGAMRRAFDLLRLHKNIDYDIADIPHEDKTTYDMIGKADTVGVFQIESRAQMSMLPRLKPRTLYDLTIQVAIVRPGPIQGDMVHPYLRRRAGLEKAELPSPELKEVLGKTLGVPLFQEQAMSIAIKCAGFTPSEADQLRRAMATFKMTGGVAHFHDKFIKGMIERSYDPEFAARCFRQIEGFGSYGFPESHAASFALLAYGSSWIKCHHPDVFCCALLNAWPMGFYQPAQLIRDAKEHGVEIRPVDVNCSHWECTLEPSHPGRMAVRIGLKFVHGLNNKEGARIAVIRTERPYESVEDLQLRALASDSTIEQLAHADAFGTLKLNRRQAHWDARGLQGKPLPLFAETARAGVVTEEPQVQLRPMTQGKEVVEDYGAVGFSLKAHPIHFLRTTLAAEKVVPARDLKTIPNGYVVTVAGLVLVRQKPGSANGILFMTIEDETGHANLIVWPSLFDQQRRLLLSSRMVACKGKLQREGDVIHVIAREFRDYEYLLQTIASLGGAAPQDASPQDVLPLARDPDMGILGTPASITRNASQLGLEAPPPDDLRFSSRDFC